MKRNRRAERGATPGNHWRDPARRALIAVSASAAAVTGYMLFEAQWLQVRRLRLELPGLPAGLDGIRILHMSDLHAGTPGPGSSAMEKSVEAAADLDPDLILFTGDITDKKKELEPHVDLLSRLEARHGKFAVLGNHDHGLRKTILQDLAMKLLRRDGRRVAEEYGDEDVAATVGRCRRLLRLASFELLENECRLVEIAGARVQVCGIDDYQYGFGDLAAVRTRFDDTAGLRILLTHSPDAVADLGADDYKLVLAGHTHGGQICVPRPGGKILLSSSGSDFGDGIYQTGTVTMHVSRGVGTTLLPFRLLSRPEITLLELAAP